MKSVEPLGQFLDLNLRMQVQNGEIGLDAAAIEAVKNERVEFNAAVSRWLDQ
jgi:hypothetical protein